MDPIAKSIAAEFQRRFSEAPKYLVRAPGRVNLIGDHTDYSEGFVLPMAIDRATWIALSPRLDGRVVMHGLDHKETLEFALDHFEKVPKHWGEYAKGVAWALQQEGCRLSGFVSVMACDVPMGAGLSSSAAFELATAMAFASVSGFAWVPARMAQLSQCAENQWVGVNCGIMDQMISACGRADHALLIDCRSLETRPVPLPAGTAVVILDTSTRRGLLDSAYNERRAQCEAAARFFQVKALRDVSVERFEASAAGLDELTRRRARHVITENVRTLQAAGISDAAALGELMSASHASLRDDFAVTNRELDIIVECARHHAGCFGARMTGAGFGGCAVALVSDRAVDDFVRTVSAHYRQRTLLTANVYVCRATNGAEVIGCSPR
jgi:galactokinase